MVHIINEYIMLYNYPLYIETKFDTNSQLFGTLQEWEELPKRDFYIRVERDFYIIWSICTESLRYVVHGLLYTRGTCAWILLYGAYHEILLCFNSKVFLYVSVCHGVIYTTISE